MARGTRSVCFIDSFSSGLDDLSRKDRRDDEKVLAILRAEGRVSIFEVTASEDISGTITRLQKSGRITIQVEQYPWWKITHIDGKPLASTPQER